MSMRAGDNLPTPQDTSGGAGQAQAQASGRTAGGLAVEWVATPAQGRDPVTARFLESLSVKYGNRITDTVTSELGLEAGEALAPELAEQAIRMAETQLDVFGGANFFIELHCSAAARGAGFLAACQRTGVKPAALDAADVDRRFRTLLAQATHNNQMPLSPQDGERLLERLLQPAGGSAA